MSQVPHRLGQILVDQNKITSQQLDHALQVQNKQGGAIGAVLKELGYITERDLVRALNKQSWLRPCAACLTFLLAPFSMQCFANEHSDLNAEIHQMQSESWSDNIHANSLAHKDAVKVVLKAAWQMYQDDGMDLDTQPHWSYGLSRKGGGYNVNMTYKF